MVSTSCSNFETPRCNVHCCARTISVHVTPLQSHILIYVPQRLKGRHTRGCHADGTEAAATAGTACMIARPSGLTLGVRIRFCRHKRGQEPSGSHGCGDEGSTGMGSTPGLGHITVRTTRRHVTCFLAETAQHSGTCSFFPCCLFGCAPGCIRDLSTNSQGFATSTQGDDSQLCHDHREATTVTITLGFPAMVTQETCDRGPTVLPIHARSWRNHDISAPLSSAALACVCIRYSLLWHLDRGFLQGLLAHLRPQRCLGVTGHLLRVHVRECPRVQTSAQKSLPE